jgi:hypothetical protein
LHAAQHLPAMRLESFFEQAAAQVCPLNIDDPRRGQLVSWVSHAQPWFVLDPVQGDPDFGTFDEVLEPQKEVDLDLFSRYNVRESMVGWQPVFAYAGDMIELCDRFPKQKDSVVFAITFFYAEKPTDAYLQIGSHDACQVWINQTPVIRHKHHRPLDYPQHRQKVIFPEGWSAVLVRLDQSDQVGGFVLDAIDEQGWPLNLPWCGPPQTHFVLQDQGLIRP